MDGVTMIDKRTSEMLDPELILHIGKTNFEPIFIVFMDYKITCPRVDEFHILNGIDTLDT